MRDLKCDESRYPNCIAIGCDEPTLVPGVCYDHAQACLMCHEPAMGKTAHRHGYGIWMCDAEEEEEEELDLGTCPWYQRTGICTFGCQTEPACETCEPDEGWPTKRKQRHG